MSTFRIPSKKQTLSCWHVIYQLPEAIFRASAVAMLFLHPKMHNLAICLCWISWSLWWSFLHLFFWIVALTSNNQTFPHLSFFNVLEVCSELSFTSLTEIHWFISHRINAWETVPQTGCLLDFELLALIQICTGTFSSTL